MRLVFAFRSLGELLTTWTSDDAGNWAGAPSVPSDLKSTPSLSTVQVWGNYALVSNEHRRSMGAQPRDIVIQQHQHSPSFSFDAYGRPFQSYDIRFSHSVRALFWAVENVTIPSVHSNYTTQSPAVSTVNGSIVIDHSAEYRPSRNYNSHLRKYSPFYNKPLISLVLYNHIIKITCPSQQRLDITCTLMLSIY